MEAQNKRDLACIFLCSSLFTLLAALSPSIRSAVIAIGILSLFVSSHANKDKYLLFAVFVMGIAPTLGWSGSLNRHLDVLLWASSISIVKALIDLRRHQAHFQFWLISPSVAALFTYFWWSPIARGTQQEILSRLLGGWDHFGHFYLFTSATVNDKFVALLPNSIPGTTLYDRRYPAGIHMAWSQWWPKDVSEIEDQVAQFLHRYSISQVLTLAACVFLMSTAIGRVVQSKQLRILVAGGSAFIALAFYCFGPLSMGVSSGFPNFVVAITGSVVLLSISLKQSSSIWVTLVIASGAGLMTAYNWFPLIIPVGIISLISWLAIIRKIRGATRITYIVVSAIFLTLAMIPILMSSSNGVKHLATDGGISPLHPQLILCVLLGGCAFGVHYVRKMKSWNAILATSPIFIAFLIQLLITIPIRISEGTYPYYPQKFAYGSVFITLVTIAMSIASSVDERTTTTSKQNLTQFVPVVFGLLALSQLFGYIGPDWSNFAPQDTAIGISNRNLLNQTDPINGPLATLLIDLNDVVRDQSNEMKDCLLLIENRAPQYSIVLANYWVGSLNGTLTEEHISRSQQLVPFLTDANFPTLTAESIDTYLEPEKDCPVIRQELADELVARDEKWRNRVWSIESDGRILKYSEKE